MTSLLFTIGPVAAGAESSGTILSVTNESPALVANLSFEVSSTTAHIAGTSQLSGLSVAAGATLQLRITLRRLADNAELQLRGISFRTGGRAMRPPDISLPVERTSIVAPPAPAARDMAASLLPTRSAARSSYWEQAVRSIRHPPSGPPGRGTRVFVSFAGDLERKKHDYGINWVEALENALKRPLADLSHRLGTAEDEAVRAFVYASREQGMRPGVEALPALLQIMYAAPAAILVLSHEYPARDATWCFEAPYLMWRHRTDGMPLFIVRATTTGTDGLRYPTMQGEEMVDLRGWNCDRFGHPDMLGHHDQLNLQQLKEAGRLDDALARLNGVAAALADALVKRYRFRV